MAEPIRKWHRNGDGHWVSEESGMEHTTHPSSLTEGWGKGSRTKEVPLRHPRHQSGAKGDKTGK